LALATKKTIPEAKNYKKLLAAIQKSKIMHPTEISVLFDKANRFITKDSVKKEKQSIKKEVNEDMMVNGPSDDAASLTNPEAQEEMDDKETNKSEL